MPPFSKVIQIILNDANEEKVKFVAENIYKQLKIQLSESLIEIYGPFEGNIYKQRGRFFWQILLKSTSWKSMNQHCKHFFGKVKPVNSFKGYVFQSTLIHKHDFMHAVFIRD